MRLRPIILLVAILSIGGWFAYKSWWAEPPTFPVERTLTDRNGRTVEARVLARNELEISSVRLSDGVVFRYPIDYLSDKDREFLEPYPRSRLKTLNSGPAEPVAPTEKGKLVDLHKKISHNIQLILMDLRRPNPAGSGYTKGELQYRLKQLQDDLIDVEKDLLKLSYREGSTN